MSCLESVFHLKCVNSFLCHQIVAERKYRQQIVGFEAEKFSIVEKVAKTEQIIKEFQAKELNILDEIQNVKQRHEVDKSAWKDKYVAMETKKNAIENDLSAERLKCDAANLKLSDLKTDNDYFQATIKELKDEISKLDENHDVVTAENEQIQKKIGDVQTQVEELEKSTAELLITNKEQLKETGSLEAKAKHLEEVLAELTTEKNKGQSVKQTARAPLEINATIADDVASVDKPIVHSVISDFDSFVFFKISYDFHFRANRNVCHRHFLQVAANHVVKSKVWQVHRLMLMQVSALQTLLVEKLWIRDSKDYLHQVFR